MSIRCPTCAGPLRPKVLECGECGVRVEGEFPPSEFANLGQAELRFLRIFVHCEGRIRDMEAALGVSYPTVKQRLAEFKQRLADAVEAPRRASSASQILDALSQGEISCEEALARLRKP